MDRTVNGVPLRDTIHNILHKVVDILSPPLMGSYTIVPAPPFQAVWE